jgi:hypothetical protein
MLRLVVPNADFSANAIGFYGEDMPYSPYGFYLMGSTWGTTPKDQSGQARHCFKNGSPTQSAYWAQCSGMATCYEVPFTSAALAATNSAFTYMMLSKVDSAQSFSGMGANFTLPYTSQLSNGPTTCCQAFQNHSGTNRLDQITLDATRGTRWTMFAGAYTLTSVEVFQRYKALPVTSTNGPITYAAETVIGSIRAPRIGGDYVGTATGIGLIAAAGFWPTALTAAQLDAVYVRLQAIFNPLGLDL